MDGQAEVFVFFIEHELFGHHHFQKSNQLVFAEGRKTASYFSD
jgi:hypothetical protein